MTRFGAVVMLLTSVPPSEMLFVPEVSLFENVFPEPIAAPQLLDPQVKMSYWLIPDMVLLLKAMSMRRLSYRCPRCSPTCSQPAYCSR